MTNPLTLPKMMKTFLHDMTQDEPEVVDINNYHFQLLNFLP